MSKDDAIPTLMDEVFRKQGWDDAAVAEILPSRYFEAQERKKTVDMLTYLIEFSDQPVVLRGCDGVGKATLFEQVCSKAGNAWRIGRVAAKADMIEPELLLSIAHDFAIDLTEDYMAEALQQLTGHFMALARMGQRAVIFVEDAELLPLEAAGLLLQLHNCSGKQGEALALVFGVNEQPDQVAKNGFSALSVSSIEVQAFSPEDTRRYIAYMAEKNKQPAWVGLEDAVLESIHQQSGGIPARINALLLQPHLRTQMRRKKAGGRAGWWLVLLLVLVAVVVFVGYLGL